MVSGLISPLLAQASEFERVADKFGFPAACLVGVAIFLAFCLRWAANKLLTPLVDSHTATMKSLVENSSAQGTTLDRIAETQAAQVKVCDEHNKGLDAIRLAVERYRLKE